MKKDNQHRLQEAVDLLLTAKKVFIIQIISGIFIILSIIGFAIFEKSTINLLEKNLRQREVMILTNSAILQSQTLTDENAIVKQFAKMAFLTTLNYDNRQPQPQINFMRIYASPIIYKAFANAIREDSKVMDKIYSTYIDVTKPIKVIDISPTLFEVTIPGIQYVYGGNTLKNYRITLVMKIARVSNAKPGNMYNLEIVTYNLKRR